MITPIIVAADRQRAEVARLVEHCRLLDGTVVRVIEAEERGLGYPDRNNAALRQGALAMKGDSFIWLEPDSTPLVPGWADTLTAEYTRQCKPFLLTSDSNPPHDLIGGIGVYSGETSWLIPETIPGQGWDGWMLKHLAPLIGFTPLIQHSYGHYDDRGRAIDHRFPRDAGLMRSDAVIFHRDRYQDLTLPARPPLEARNRRFLHTHDLGDIIASLPIIRKLGGGDLVITEHPRAQQMLAKSLKGARFEALRPLLEAQSYISSVIYEDHPEGIDCDFSEFRKVYDYNRQLTDSMASWVMAGTIDLRPWLTVKASNRAAERVIIARSSRYHTRMFPWRRIARELGNKMLFVGLRNEHDDFQRLCDMSVEYEPTENFLELAELIAGSKLFIGNQSSPCWVAMGLGHPLIQETSPWNPDSIVRRDNAQFFEDNNITLPEL